jgi:hypothetical protein
MYALLILIYARAGFAYMGAYIEDVYLQHRNDRL